MRLLAPSLVAVASLTMVVRPVRATQDSTLVTMLASVVRGPQFLLETPSRARVPIDLARTPRLQRRITVSLDGVPMREALTEVARQAGIRLMYSDDVVATSASVRLRAESITVAAALTDLLVGAEVDVVFTRAGDASLVRRPTPPQPGAIVGRVTDANSGAPLLAASIQVEGTRLSASTEADGRYRIAEVPLGRRGLVIRRIGYQVVNREVTVTDGATVTADVGMQPSAFDLSAIVVTGTAGNQERKAQSALVASIDPSDLMAKAPVVSVGELLSARTPGVSVTKASGTTGAYSRIDIRGQASINISNDPLVFIDGVRATYGQRNLVAVGGQTLDPLDDLNPDDIESIEIVKGPAAATLYGADASAGVIQIITKKGKVGVRRFIQKVTTEYNHIDPGFTSHTNYAACSAADVAPTSEAVLCRGKVAGDVVTDNPLVRQGGFRNGWAGSLTYGAQGGGDNYGFYTSLRGDNEDGTLPNSGLKRLSGRANVNWSASSKLNLNVNVGLSRNNQELPEGDQGDYSYMLGSGLGSPLTVRAGANGALTGGWLDATSSVESISAIVSKVNTLRSTLSAQLFFAPVSWFTHRVTVGGDLARSSATQMFPINPFEWYSGNQANGWVQLTEANTSLYTVDYLGNLSHRMGRDGWLSSNFSFGGQWINSFTERLGGVGQGLLSNASNLVSSATVTTATQGYAHSKSLGYFVQEQLGLRDRLFVQLAARIDRNSAFGNEAGSFFLPKAGLSYVMSQEPYWRGLSGFISTFRVRAAYGTTGRSPTPGASLQTYRSSVYVTDAGVLVPGILPGSPGNANLKPERGTEFEAGIDAGFFGGRANLEVTYFRKASKDVLVVKPVAASSGFSLSPFVNAGEMVNQGLELSLRATPIDRRNLTWDAGINLNTLSNKLIDLGGVAPFVNNFRCIKPGYEIAAWCAPRIRSVDTVARRVTVSDTVEYLGGQLPKYEASINTTVTLLRNVRIYGLFDGKFQYHVFNFARYFRDRFFVNSSDVVLAPGQGGYSTAESLRRLGPYVSERTGATVAAGQAIEPYIVAGDYVRFRELSVTWQLPTRFAQSLRVSNLSLTVGGRNLALWTKYDGFDPEVNGVDNQGTLHRVDMFTVPQARRLFTRLNVQF